MNSHKKISWNVIKYSLMAISAIVIILLMVGAAQTTVFEDDFSTNLDKWIPFGSPSPQVLGSIEGRSGVFDNNGDGNCDSGVVSKDAFSLTNGFTMESDIFLRVTNPAGCWVDAFIGLTKDNSPAVNSLCAVPKGILFRIYYAGDACWQTPADKMRHAYLDGGFYTEGGAWESFVGYVNADAYIDSWHKFKVVVGEDRYVKFYVDDTLIYPSTNKIDPAILEGKKINLDGRSSGSAGKVYHDNIKLTSGQTALPDLSISSEDISFLPDDAKIGDNIPIIATIQNIGNAGANNVVVQFFEGNPVNGGAKIGNDQIIPSIDAGETGNAQVSWVVKSMNDIYVVIDLADNIQEQNEGNNVENMAVILSGFTPLKNGWAFANYAPIDFRPIVDYKWGGECLGMSAAAQQLYLSLIPGSITPDMLTSTCNPKGDCRGNPGPLPSAICPNRFNIENLQIGLGAAVWFQSHFSIDIRDWSQVTTNTMNNNEYPLIKWCLNNNIPVVLQLGPNADSLHAVVAYKVKEFSTRKEIFVYDPNCPNSNFPMITLSPQAMSYNNGRYTKYRCYMPNIPMMADVTNTNDAIDAIIKLLSDIISNSLDIAIESPCYLKVNDPNGLTTSKDAFGIPNAKYIQENLNNEGHIEDIIFITDRKIGTYQITVIPKPDANPTDTYTLRVYSNGTTLTLAKNTPISKIPDKPYIITVTHNGIIQPSLKVVSASHGFIEIGDQSAAALGSGSATNNVKLLSD